MTLLSSCNGKKDMYLRKKKVFKEITLLMKRGALFQHQNEAQDGGNLLSGYFEGGDSSAATWTWQNILYTWQGNGLCQVRMICVMFKVLLDPCRSSGYNSGAVFIIVRSPCNSQR